VAGGPPNLLVTPTQLTSTFVGVGWACSLMSPFLPPLHHVWRASRSWQHSVLLDFTSQSCRGRGRWPAPHPTQLTSTFVGVGWAGTSAKPPIHTWPKQLCALQQLWHTPRDSLGGLAWLLQLHDLLSPLVCLPRGCLPRVCLPAAASHSPREDMFLARDGMFGPPLSCQVGWSGCSS
jgi:hypothetical protein